MLTFSKITSVCAEADEYETQDAYDYWIFDDSGIRGWAMELYGVETLTLHVSDSIENWAIYFYDCEPHCFNISAFTADEDSKKFRVVDGVLFSYDMTKLLQYPPMKTGWYYQIPSSVVIIGETAFMGSYYQKELVIPDSVQVIDGGDTFYESCIETMHFPKSIEYFNTDCIEYLPCIRRIIIPENSTVLNKLKVFAGGNFRELWELYP